MSRRSVTMCAALAVALVVVGCGSREPSGESSAGGKPEVLTTSGLLADLVGNVAGEHVELENLVPDGADLHTYEPTLRQTRDVATADLAFTHFTAQERSSLTRLLDTNLPDRARNLNLGDATEYGVSLLAAGGGDHAHPQENHGSAADEPHPHGRVDPHIWQDVSNARAYVRMIASSLEDLDPQNRADYRANAERYDDDLRKLDDYVRTKIAAIPRERRRLVTTHAGFGYLAKAYDIELGGYITAGPETEPSLTARRDLVAAIEAEKVPAVFIESNLKSRSSTLREIAREVGAEVCTIYGDALDERVKTYGELMRFNADSLNRCLVAR